MSLGAIPYSIRLRILNLVGSTTFVFDYLFLKLFRAPNTSRLTRKRIGGREKPADTREASDRAVHRSRDLAADALPGLLAGGGYRLPSLGEEDPMAA